MTTRIPPAAPFADLSVFSEQTCTICTGGPDERLKKLFAEREDHIAALFAIEREIDQIENRLPSSKAEASPHDANRKISSLGKEILQPDGRARSFSPRENQSVASVGTRGLAPNPVKGPTSGSLRDKTHAQAQPILPAHHQKRSSDFHRERDSRDSTTLFKKPRSSKEPDFSSKRPEEEAPFQTVREGRRAFRYKLVQTSYPIGSVVLVKSNNPPDLLDPKKLEGMEATIRGYSNMEDKMWAELESKIRGTRFLRKIEGLLPLPTLNKSYYFYRPDMNAYFLGTIEKFLYKENDTISCTISLQTDWVKQESYFVGVNLTSLCPADAFPLDKFEEIEALYRMRDQTRMKAYRLIG